MRLYLISQTVNNDYDTYDSAVVAAPSEEQARRIHPGGGGWYISDRNWCDPKDVTVQYIGMAAATIKENCVICSSFNAG